MAQALVAVQQEQPDRFAEARAAISNERLRAAMLAIAGELMSEANRRVGLRNGIEERWIEDLQQYHGRYDVDTERELKDAVRSRLFINMTRPKTNAMGARYKDLLFPTDDRCWAIQPTPVPRMAQAAERAASEAQMLADQAKQAEQAANDNPNPQAEANKQATATAAETAKQTWAKLNADLEEAKRRASLMQEVIEDQLTECNYQAVKRDQIDWAMKIGTGITKGPVTGDLVRKGWQQPVDQAGQPTGPHELKMAYGTQPSHRLVDPWGFFPDPDVANIKDGAGVFERHLKNATKLRQLAKLSGFDVDAIRRLLDSKPIGGAPSYIASLRNIREEAQAVAGPLYQVWEYNGPLTPEQMRTLSLAMNNRAAFDVVTGDVDQLAEMQGCVWFCDNEVLKFQLYPLDSGEPMYSVFNLVKDESSIFGYGMPAILRDLQSAFNAAWRGMMDNAGISSGPQIVIDTSTIKPADGDMTIRPRKLWYATKGITKENPPFQVFNIQNNQNELANIITLAARFIDDVSMTPQMAQGDVGSMPKDTPVGTTVLAMNAVNVIFRDGVKNFDDDVTVPDIRRQYDWNMQFGQREDIKGDYDVKATGSSVLLVREIQAQSLMAIALNFGGHPIYGPMLKNYELLGKIFQAHMIPVDEVMLSKEQFETIVAQAAQQQAEAAKAESPEQLRLKATQLQVAAQIEIANMETATKRFVAEHDRDTAMMQLAAKGNMKLDELQAMLAGKQMEIDHKERSLAVETAVTQQQPAHEQHGGGYL